jgi:hypothetical protein
MERQPKKSISGARFSSPVHHPGEFGAITLDPGALRYVALV